MSDKLWTKTDIVALLNSEDTKLREAAQKRALLAIYHRQTQDEKRMAATVEHNKVGFNGVDAEIMTSFSLQLIQRAWLSPKQMALVSKKIQKYAGQLADIANGLK
jgi:hypothetical protein